MCIIDISVVVCTYNRAALLRGALESLMALRTDGRFSYEILVVDNASTDDTPQVVEQIRQGATGISQGATGISRDATGVSRDATGVSQGATGVSPVPGVGQVAERPSAGQIGNPSHDTGKMPVAPVPRPTRDSMVPIRSVREPRKGVACARNCGIQCAVGSWIAFFDDDQVADPAWLLELFNAATSRSARVVGGAVRLLLSEDALAELPTVCRQLLGESVALPAPERFHRKLTAASGSLLVHRTVFKEVGAFDETLREAGEDTDLSRRMQAAGIEGWYVPASIAYHTVPAYRREEGYFRWTSLRNGMHLARRERQPLGWPLFVLVLLARMARVGVKHVPQYAWGRLCGSRTTRLAAQCQLWRIEGYVRAALAAASPRLFPQERFLASMDFRSERQTFVGGARPSAAT